MLGIVGSALKTKAYLYRPCDPVVVVSRIDVSGKVDTGVSSVEHEAVPGMLKLIAHLKAEF